MKTIIVYMNGEEKEYPIESTRMNKTHKGSKMKGKYNNPPLTHTNRLKRYKEEDFDELL